MMSITHPPLPCFNISCVSCPAMPAVKLPILSLSSRLSVHCGGHYSIDQALNHRSLRPLLDCHACRLWTPHIGTVVSRKHLAATAQHEWKLQHYISSSTPQSLVATGTNSSNGSSSVGVNRLGETFEAVIGAMIIDSNFAIVQATLLPWIAGSCCTMCDYTIQKLAWKTQAAAATSKKTTVNNSLEHQDASGELAKASAQPTAEPCRPSSEESALQGHKQPAATAARAPAASSCKSKYQNLMAASSDQKTQCRLKKQRQEVGSHSTVAAYCAPQIRWMLKIVLKELKELQDYQE